MIRVSEKLLVINSLLTIARYKYFTVTIYQIENIQSSPILFRVKHSEGIVKPEIIKIRNIRVSFAKRSVPIHFLLLYCISSFGIWPTSHSCTQYVRPHLGIYLYP